MMNLGLKLSQIKPCDVASFRDRRVNDGVEDLVEIKKVASLIKDDFGVLRFS